MKKTLSFLTLWLAAVLFFSGCVVQQAAQVMQTSARSMEPDPGRALVYVIREKQLGGSALNWNVDLDGQRWGTVAAGTYLAGQLEAGPHTVAASGFIGSTASAGINPAPGGRYYYLMNMGLMGGVSITQLAEERGRELVDSYNLSAENNLAHTLRTGTSQPLPASRPPAPAPVVTPPPPAPAAARPPAPAPQPTLQPAAITERRIALVIGNGAYRESPLRNPVNDAGDIAEVLRKCGFNVSRHINVGRSAMRAAIRAFGDQIRQGGVGLLYYAGHGVQVDGENYLLPVDARVEREYEIQDEGVRVSTILEAMQAANNTLNIIILDACRNNPFSAKYRSKTRGLARMDAPRGSLVVYATAPGDTAEDGAGRNGLFTSGLLKHIFTPGLPVESMLKKVRVEVVEASGGRQVPWSSSSLMGEFYFVPAAGGGR